MMPCLPFVIGGYLCRNAEGIHVTAFVVVDRSINFPTLFGTLGHDERVLQPCQIKGLGSGRERHGFLGVVRRDGCVGRVGGSAENKFAVDFVGNDEYLVLIG